MTVGEASSQAVRSAREVSARLAQLPQDPQGPAPAQEIEQRHDRAAGARAPDGGSFMPACFGYRSLASCYR